MMARSRVRHLSGGPQIENQSTNSSETTVAVLLSVVGVMYGLFWPIYWFVRLIEVAT